MNRKLFRNRNRPRVCLDLKVGNSHIVEVLLHLRRVDWEWYQSNHLAIEEELLRLVEESILSRIFAEEIEAYHRKINPGIFPKETVGSKNKTNKNNTRNRKKSRKGNVASATATKEAEQPSVDTTKPKDVYYAFGEVLQLAYRKQELQAWNQVGRTIFFKDKLEEQDTEFHDRIKLSSRLLVWCSRVDARNKTNPDPENAGFFRQEMLPISALFREPKNLK